MDTGIKPNYFLLNDDPTRLLDLIKKVQSYDSEAQLPPRLRDPNSLGQRLCRTDLSIEDLMPDAETRIVPSRHPFELKNIFSGLLERGPEFLKRPSISFIDNNMKVSEISEQLKKCPDTLQPEDGSSHYDDSKGAAKVFGEFADKMGNYVNIMAGRGSRRSNFARLISEPNPDHLNRSKTDKDLDMIPRSGTDVESAVQYLEALQNMESPDST